MLGANVRSKDRSADDEPAGVSAGEEVLGGILTVGGAVAEHHGVRRDEVGRDDEPISGDELAHTTPRPSSTITTDDRPSIAAPEGVRRLRRSCRSGACGLLFIVRPRRTDRGPKRNLAHRPFGRCARALASDGHLRGGVLHQSGAESLRGGVSGVSAETLRHSNAEHQRTGIAVEVINRLEDEFMKVFAARAAAARRRVPQFVGGRNYVV